MKTPYSDEATAGSKGLEADLLGITIVIPARNAADLVEACIESVIAQLKPVDCLIVVDDASDDDTTRLAKGAGAEVLTLRSRRGPYVARQTAADIAGTPLLLFFDVRCRARPGWLEAHRTLLSDRDTALSFTGVNVISGAAFAERVAAADQLFSADRYSRYEYLPYFPTCNLGTTTAAFRRVGGFADVRGGGDAEFCWRVQEAGLGKASLDTRNLVDWIPRKTVGALWRQFRRYGDSSYRIRRDRGLSKHTAVGLAGVPFRLVRKFAVGILYKRASPSEALGIVLTQAAYEVGYWGAHFRTDQASVGHV